MSRDAQRSFAVSAAKRSVCPLSLPVLTEHEQGRGGQRYVAVFGTFAAMNMNHSAFGVDVSCLQVQSFIEAQSHRIDGSEKSSHPLGSGGINDGVDLLAGQHFGKRVDILQFEHGEDVPVTFASDGEKEFDARECDTK